MIKGREGSMKRKGYTFILLLLIFLVAFIYGEPTGAQSENQTLYKGVRVDSFALMPQGKELKKQGVTLVYLPIDIDDKLALTQTKRAYYKLKKAEISVGFYYNATAKTLSEARKEAEQFVDTIAGTDPDVKLAVCYYRPSTLTDKEYVDVLEAFTDTLHRLSGKEVVVYTNEFHLSLVSCSDFPLWVRGYTSVNTCIHEGVEAVALEKVSGGVMELGKETYHTSYFKGEIYLEGKYPLPQ